MRTYLPTIRCAWLFFGVAVMIAIAGVAPAEQRGDKKSLETAYDKTDKDRRPFLSGKQLVVSATDKKLAAEVAKAAAEYHMFRITIRSYYDATPPAPTVDTLHKEFAAMVAIGEKNPNKGYNNILGPALVESMKDVLTSQDRKKDAPIIVNAAMMLPTMARLKSDAVGKYLAELVNNKESHPVVRFYALKGLKEFAPIAQLAERDIDITDKGQNDRRAVQTEYIEALTKFIEAPVDVTGMTRGQFDAVRFVRREAISSLAHAGSPAVLAVNKKSDAKKDILQGPVAPTLLKVLWPKGGLVPPPSLQEKIEAVHGLLVMKYKNMPEYNPDAATYLIGQALLQYTQEYNIDSAKLVGKDKAVPFIPWKIEARRLQDEMKEFAKNNPTKAAAELKANADDVLAAMLKYNDAQTLILFRRAAETWVPNDRNVFKSFKLTAIPLK